MKLEKCLCCDSALIPVLDWGLMTLANNYNVNEKFPLKLNKCTECHHLQLDESVDPEIMFKDYPYFSGTSQTSRDFFNEFAETALRIKPDAKNVLDIACNDGSQLDAFKKLGLNTNGVDPAQNLLSVSKSKGHNIVCDMFPSKTTDGYHFDIITAQNVVAHVPNPLEFLKSCKEIMRDDSILMIATSQANMIIGTEFDTIYHEHISYFNTLSMKKLCENAGLILEDVFTHTIHGTSYIFVIRKVETKNPVSTRIDKEFKCGLYEDCTYNKWVEDCYNKAADKRNEIEKYKESGYTIVGCGAAAKGITFLNMSKTMVDFMVDTTPAKWYSETCNTSIYPFEYLKTRKDEKILFVILAWNFEKEITLNIKKYRNNVNDIFINTNEKSINISSK